MSTQAVGVDIVASGHVRSLDGLRGLAILMVLILHISDRFHYHGVLMTAVGTVAYVGWTGVDLFFVLSGFLITGILWDTRETAHYFRNFYARRTLRIFPLYYATLILLLFIVPATAPLIAHLPRGRDGLQAQISAFAVAAHYWPLFFCYLANVLVAWKGFDFWMTHFWSLAVEEHFYLVWPLVVYLLKRRTLIITSALLVMAALILRTVALPFVVPRAIYVLTFFRMDGLALGALLALLWRMPEYNVKVSYWARLTLPVAGLTLAGAFYDAGNTSQYGFLIQSIGYSASILFYGSLLVRVLNGSWLNAIFSLRFLRFFGKYSYSIYIFHVLPLAIFAPHFALGDPTHSSILIRALKHLSVSQTLPLSGILLFLDGLVYVLLVSAASTGIALVSWRLIEAPCLRLKRFFAYEDKGRPVDGAAIVADLVRS